jgi:hypothetical protein
MTATASTVEAARLVGVPVWLPPKNVGKAVVHSFHFVPFAKTCSSFIKPRAPRTTVTATASTIEAAKLVGIPVWLPPGKAVAVGIVEAEGGATVRIAWWLNMVMI